MSSSWNPCTSIWRVCELFARRTGWRTSSNYPISTMIISKYNREMFYKGWTWDIPRENFATGSIRGKASKETSPIQQLEPEGCLCKSGCKFPLRDDPIWFSSANTEYRSMIERGNNIPGWVLPETNGSQEIDFTPLNATEQLQRVVEGTAGHLENRRNSNKYDSSLLTII